MKNAPLFWSRFGCDQENLGSPMWTTSARKRAACGASSCNVDGRSFENVWPPALPLIPFGWRTGLYFLRGVDMESALQSDVHDGTQETAFGMCCAVVNEGSLAAKLLSIALSRVVSFSFRPIFGSIWCGGNSDRIECSVMRGSPVHPTLTRWLRPLRGVPRP